MIESIILFGPPGSGKGTQANLLKQYYLTKGLNYETISSGDLIKKYGDDPECQKSKQDGSIISDVGIFRLFDNYVGDLKNYDGLIIDGIPRVKTQTPMLLQRTTPKAIFYLNVTENQKQHLHKRLLNRGRDYDLTHNQREERITEFEILTLPALYLFHQNRVNEISAIGEPLKIHEEIKSFLQ
jgi:adenylate kinase